MSVTAAQLLTERLGLTDEELLTILDADPLAVVTGDLEHRAQLPLLLALTAEPAEQVGVPALHRWLRVAGPHGRPIDLLLTRAFGAFEDALETLQARGLVVRSPGRRP